MTQKELYSKRLERVGLDLYGKKYKAPLAAALEMDRTQLWKHLKGDFDGTKTAIEYEKILNKLEETVGVQMPEPSDEIRKLTRHIQLLQDQMKKVFEKLGIEGYQELKW